jgi:integrase
VCTLPGHWLPQWQTLSGLQWLRFDPKQSTHSQAGSGQKETRIAAVKTEYSEDELPLDPAFAAVLKAWKKQCPKSPGGWVFPSPFTDRCYHASPIQQDYIRPAGKKLGLKSVGWHTFRHSYRSWLDATGAPLGVQQKLLRHAHIGTTMQYGNALMESKRDANSKVIRMARPLLRQARA